MGKDIRLAREFGGTANTRKTNGDSPEKAAKKAAEALLTEGHPAADVRDAAQTWLKHQD